MPTRNVVLTDHQQDVVDALVASGRYQNASEAVRAGVRLLEERELDHLARLDALRRAADAGIADIAEGRSDDVAADDLDDYLESVDTAR